MEHFSLRTVTTLNDYDVMVVKLLGPFVWHRHDETDDLFRVLKNQFDLEPRDCTVALGKGQLLVVPKGIKHRPMAREEVHQLLVGPKGTSNTGGTVTAALCTLT